MIHMILEWKLNLHHYVQNTIQLIIAKYNRSIEWVADEIMNVTNGLMINFQDRENIILPGKLTYVESDGGDGSVRCCYDFPR
jgi:hypothetical protein